MLEENLRARRPRIEAVGLLAALWALAEAAADADSVQAGFRRALVPGLGPELEVYAASGSARCR